MNSAVRVLVTDAPNVVDWLTLAVAGLGGVTGLLALKVSHQTAQIARRTELQISRREQHFDTYDALMRTARELDAAVVGMVGGGGRYGEKRPLEERQAVFDTAYGNYIQAQDDVAARAPRDVRTAAGRFGNLAISAAGDPGAFGQQMSDARNDLEEKIRRELGTDELAD